MAQQRGLKRLTYTHEAMVELILAEPAVKTAELAEIFGYSEGWILQVVKSDSFQSRLAQRKAQLTDPVIAQSVEDRLRGVALNALGLVEEKLDKADTSGDYALEALGIASHGLGLLRKVSV